MEVLSYMDVTHVTLAIQENLSLPILITYWINVSQFQTVKAQLYMEDFDRVIMAYYLAQM